MSETIVVKDDNYKLAYEILMEYFDFIPDVDRPMINHKLREAGL